MIHDDDVITEDVTLVAQYIDYNTYRMSEDAPFPATPEHPLTVTTAWDRYPSDLYLPYRMFDGDKDTFWHPGGYSIDPEVFKLPTDIDISYLEPVIVESLSMYRHNLSLGNQYHIKDFDLLGSNDYQIWEQIGSFTVTDPTPDTTSTFDVNAQKAYKFYRLHVTSNYPNYVDIPALIAIAELNLKIRYS